MVYQIEMNHENLAKDVNEYIDRLEASKFQSILHLDTWIHNWMFHQSAIDEYSKSFNIDIGPSY